MAKIKDKQQETNASLGYSGSVELKLMRGKKVIKTIKTHNAGKLDLFKFIANTLIGKFETLGTPKYVLLGSGVNDTVAVRVSSNAIPYSNVYIETSSSPGDTHASAVFKFLVPFSSLSLGSEVNIIRLYSQSSVSWENHIAYFELSEPLISDGKSNILITWTMKITNQAE
jgi:hypothetical protein